MCDGHDDKVAVGEHVELIVVLKWVAQGLRRHEPWGALDGGAASECGCIDGSGHPKVGQLGHVGHLVDKDVVGTEVVVHQLGGVAVKVHQTLGCLTENHHLVNKGELFLWCRLQHQAQTGVHLLQHHDGGAGRVVVDPQELNNLRVSQCSPRCALFFERCDEGLLLFLR